MNNITSLIDMPQTSNELEELSEEVLNVAEGIKSAVEKAKDDNDLEKIKQMHRSLLGGSNFNDKLKYGIWVAGVVVSLIVGLIVASVMGSQLDNVAPLTGVVGWIELLVVVIFGAIGWFTASMITDKRR